MVRQGRRCTPPARHRPVRQPGGAPSPARDDRRVGPRAGTARRTRRAPVGSPRHDHPTRVAHPRQPEQALLRSTTMLASAAAVAVGAEWPLRRGIAQTTRQGWTADYSASRNSTEGWNVSPKALPLRSLLVFAEGRPVASVLLVPLDVVALRINAESRTYRPSTSLCSNGN